MKRFDIRKCYFCNKHFFILYNGQKLKEKWSEIEYFHIFKILIATVIFTSKKGRPSVISPKGQVNTLPDSYSGKFERTHMIKSSQNLESWKEEHHFFPL